MRHYAAKRPRRDADRRMDRAVALVHVQGKSRREAAALLRCSEGTIRNDLARWASRHAPSNVVPFPGTTDRVSEPRKSAPVRGSSTHPVYAAEAQS